MCCEAASILLIFERRICSPSKSHSSKYPHIKTFSGQDIDDLTAAPRRLFDIVEYLKQNSARTGFEM